MLFSFYKVAEQWNSPKFRTMWLNIGKLWPMVAFSQKVWRRRSRSKQSAKAPNGDKAGSTSNHNFGKFEPFPQSPSCVLKRDLNPPYSHSVRQHMDRGLRVSIEVIVSMPQTHSLWKSLMQELGRAASCHSWSKSGPILECEIQWSLVIMRILGPWQWCCYIRGLLHKTFTGEKLVLL